MNKDVSDHDVTIDVTNRNNSNSNEDLSTDYDSNYDFEYGGFDIFENFRVSAGNFFGRVRSNVSKVVKRVSEVTKEKFPQTCEKVFNFANVIRELFTGDSLDVQVEPVDEHDIERGVNSVNSNSVNSVNSVNSGVSDVTDHANSERDFSISITGLRNRIKRVYEERIARNVNESQSNVSEDDLVIISKRDIEDSEEAG